jgi:hypothetical protein
VYPVVPDKRLVRSGVRGAPDFSYLAGGVGCCVRLPERLAFESSHTDAYIIDAYIIDACHIDANPLDARLHSTSSSAY